MYLGQKLQLNGFRPEGIGRTLLPSLLGNHRISSVFLEPVSLGNFAVLLAAWGLAKPREELRSMLFYLASAMVFITLADSRFGLGMIFILMFVRWALDSRLNMNTVIACLSPFLVVLGLIALGMFYAKVSEDSLVGRLTWTGVTLLRFGVDSILGTFAPLPNFGDMGYAYLCSRFGLPLCAFLWFSFLLIKNTTEAGLRFRAYVAIYVSLILSVSGTSLFALKTAGIVWFLFGTLSALSESQQTPSLRLRSLQPV
jgi:putative polymerase